MYVVCCICHIYIYISYVCYLCANVHGDILFDETSLELLEDRSDGLARERHATDL